MSSAFAGIHPNSGQWCIAPLKAGYLARVLPRTLVVLLCASTCARPITQPVEVTFFVEPLQLDFGGVTVSARDTRFVTVTNTSRASVVFTLEADAPFDTDATLTLAAGEAQTVPVTFVPRRLGAVSASLRITAPDASPVTVALTAEGLAPPACATPWSCWEAHLDQGQCVTEKRPDGTACAETCLSAATCRNGVCVGEALTCADDGDACTAELCTAGQGCHAVARRCAPSTDPCKVSRCDARLGCVEDDATDGVFCGPSRGCGAASVCISGQCVVRALPDGAACGSTSPCQSAGRCSGGTCAQPAPVPLRPMFTSNGHSAFGPLSLGDGGLMRVPGPTQTWEQRFDARSFHLSADGLFVGQPDYRSIAVANANDGRLLWSSLLPALFPGVRCPGGGPLTYFNLYELALDGTDELLLRGWQQCGPTGSRFDNVVVAVDRQTGTPRWVVLRSEFSPYGLVGAATGGAWFLDGSPRRLVRASRQGAVSTLALPSDAEELLAVVHGVAWVRGRSVVHAVPLDGGVIASTPWTAGVRSGSSLTDWNGSVRYVSVFSPDGGLAILGGGPAPQSLGDAGTSTDATLARLADGSTLVCSLEGSPLGRTVVSLVGPAGDLTWQCVAPAYAAYAAVEVQHGVAVLGDLGAYSLPGLEAAPEGSGWTQRFATPSRTGREVP